MPARQIYLLRPRELSPETIAVTFAKTSRSPESFRQIAAELTDAQSAQFHEKWVVGYGHASVAEHAVLHIAIENISRLAVECLESNRLASYTEKSTRYQTWTADSFYVPPELADSRHAELYRQTLADLFATYQRSLEPVRRLMQTRFPRQADESEARWEGRLRSKYIDHCRFLLPAAALANVGMTANARVLESALRKMLSHPLAEVRAVGAELKRVAQAEVPTLVKYAEAAPYQSETAQALTQLSRQIVTGPPAPAAPGAGLVDYDVEGEDKFLAACLYRFGEQPLAQCRAAVRALSADQKAALARAALGRLGPYDLPLRELEYVTYTFDLVMDQGAYFEIKRHRMMTQTPQRLTCALGYSVPRALVDAGCGADYAAALQRAAAAYARLAPDFPEAASYVVPNGFNRRLLVTLNLREAFHLCNLRSKPSAHFSARCVAGQIQEHLRRVHPTLAAFMAGDSPAWPAIAAEYFAPAG